MQDERSKPLIEANNVGLTYKSLSLIGRFKYQALSDISFQVMPGETFGIMGRNGCGKSSLLRILADIIAPSEGEVLTHRPITRAMLTLGLGFNQNLTGRNNALLSAMLQGASKKEARAMLEEIKTFSEFGNFFEQPVRTYSAGMRARLGFATAVKINVDLLLIDETLSVGDASFNKKAEQILLNKINSEQTVIFVSHNANQVSKLCKRALWLEQGSIKASGDVKSVSAQYQKFMQSLKVTA